MIFIVLRCHLRIIFAGFLLFLIFFALASFAQVLGFLLQSALALSWLDWSAGSWIGMFSNMAKISFAISLFLQPIFHLVIIIPLFFSKFRTVEKYYENVEKRQITKFGK